MMWLYLPKFKVEAPEVFLQFCELIFNPYGVTIKWFRSNNRTEFFNAAVNSYFSSRGIYTSHHVLILPSRVDLQDRRLGFVFQSSYAQGSWGKVGVPNIT